MNLTQAMVHLLGAVQHLGQVCDRTRRMIFAAIARLQMKMLLESV